MASPSRFTQAKTFPLLVSVLPLAFLTLGNWSVGLVSPGDGAKVTSPTLHYAMNEITSGRFPRWNTHVFAGTPLFGAGQAPVFFPTSWFHSVFSIGTATNLRIGLTFVIAALGAYKLVEYLTQSPPAALVAGIYFSFSGFMYAHLGHQFMIQVVALMPWILLAYMRSDRRVLSKSGITAVVLVALSWLAGHPHMTVLSILALLVFAMFDSRGSLAASLRAAMLIALLGSMLASVQLLPLLATSAQSTRATADVAHVQDVSLNVNQLPTLMFPMLGGAKAQEAPFDEPFADDRNYGFTELVVYAGIVAMALIAITIPNWRTRKTAQAALLLIALGILLALMPYPLADLISRMPMLKSFRGWSRALVLVNLGISILLGFAMFHLEDLGQRALRFRGLAVLCAAIVAAIAVSNAAPLGVNIANTPESRLLPLAVLSAFVLAIIVMSSFAGSRRWLPAIVVLLVLVDLAGNNAWYTEWRTLSPSIESYNTSLEPGTNDFGEAPDEPGGIDRYFYVSWDARPGYESFDNRAMLRNEHWVNGQDPLANATFLRYSGLNQIGELRVVDRALQADNRILDLLRATVLLSHDGVKTTDMDERFGSPSRKIAFWGDQVVSIYPYSPRVADAFLVGAVYSFGEDWKTNPRPDVTTSVGLIEPCPECEILDTPGKVGSATRYDTHPGNIRVDYQAERAGMLVVSEAFSPGWQATLDGQALEVRQIEGIVMGVVVPRGDGIVQFTYSQPGLRLGVLVSLLTGLGLLVAGLRLRRLLSHDPEL